MIEKIDYFGEIASHGYRWIDYKYFSEAQEKEHLEKAKPSFTKSRLNEHFTDDELIDLMNKLSLYLSKARLVFDLV